MDSNSPRIGIRRIASLAVVIVILLSQTASTRTDDLESLHDEIQNVLSVVTATEDSNRIVMALHRAEAICLMQETRGLEDEGILHWAIGDCIRILVKAERVDVLSEVLEYHMYFPHATTWIMEWLGERSEEWDILNHKRLDAAYSEDEVIQSAIDLLASGQPPSTNPTAPESQTERQ